MTLNLNPQWLRHLGGPRDAPVHLICFPHAGGSASYFQRWVTALPAGMALFALQLPLREERINEAPISDIATLLQQLMVQLSAGSVPQRILFGHSMGATLAWELALRLQATGMPPHALCVSGQTPPDQNHQTDFHRRSDRALIEEVMRFSATPRELFEYPALREMVLAQLRHDYTLIERWQPSTQAVLQAPIHVFHGTQDSELTPAQAQGWSDFTGETFQLSQWPGDHFYLNQHWRAVLRQIAHSLALPELYSDMP